MPNWCSNKIIIVGAPDNIKSVISKIREIPEGNKCVLFETLIGKDEKSGDWYESNLKRYGTKWDVSVNECRGEFNENSIHLYPSTAWSPPVPFCMTLAKEYGVNVEIVYWESGNDFCGRVYINQDGVVESEDDYDYNEGMYNLMNEDFWNDRENDYLDDMESDSIREYVEENFSFVNEDDKIRIIEIYKNLLVENSEE